MIALVTTVKNRTQHLQLTLPRNLADNRNYPDCRFVVVNYNSQDHLNRYIRENHQADLDSGRLSFYEYICDKDTPFRMAHAKNLAHRLGMMEGGQILVNMDADNYTGEGFAEYVGRAFVQQKDIFLWARMIKEGPDRMPRGSSGRIAVTAHTFMKSGGYDEKYHTWAPDDKDFNLRLQRIGYIPIEIPRKFLDVVNHNDKMRFREYPHLRQQQSCYEFETVDKRTDTIANWGQFGMGTVRKNFNPATEIELLPFPTRIFGIGMHKTATTSLHHALKILGFDSAHWKNAHWAKAIYNQMTTGSGRSGVLERSYALSDLPISVLYKELDKAYPGSKFILTVRSIQKWLNSIRRHWDSESNRFRDQWDNDPFTHKIHKIVYGQKNFEPMLFAKKYMEHNMAVLDYFRGRDGDLLIMDMDNGAGWKELCGFLSVPEPNVPYPNVSPTKRS